MAARSRGYTLTPYIGSTAQTPDRSGQRFSDERPSDGLTNGTAYTFTVKRQQRRRRGPRLAGSAAVTPQDTIFDFPDRRRSTPATRHPSSSASSSPPTVAGTITGIRFYKAADQHRHPRRQPVDLDRDLLASATFTGETASGWQQVNFATPVTITADTTYVAAYLAPKGHYSAPLRPHVRGPQRPAARAGQRHHANGVYTYTATTVFPTNAYSASNYFVDVDFAPAPRVRPPAPTARHGDGGARERDRELDARRQRRGPITNT